MVLPDQEISMIEFKRPQGVREDKLRERQESMIKEGADGIERLDALLQYTAMMADVELPEEEDEDE